MNYYVKELADKKAILVAEDGYELEVFPSVKVAIDACCRECLVRPLWVESYDSDMESRSPDFDMGYIKDNDMDFSDLLLVY